MNKNSTFRRNLSGRLRLIASFVSPGNRLADIGTDHAYIPVFLAAEGMIPSAIAMDLREGPLNGAKEHIRETGVEKKVIVRISDGMKELKPKEADTVLISGLGGELLIRILTEAEETVKSSISEFILSPHTEWGAVRCFLRENGFRIQREAMIREDGKYYTVMAASFRKKEDRDLYAEAGRRGYGIKTCDAFGPYLILKRDAVLLEYLEKEKKAADRILEGLPKEGERTEKRSEELREYIRQIEEVLFNDVRGNFN